MEKEISPCKNVPLLELKHLNICFNELNNTQIHAVNDVSLTINKGEILGIVGESGSGKSQTMLSIMGLLASNASVSGEAWFENQDLLNLSKNELNKLRGSKIAMIFQDPMTSLNPYLKIRTQLLEVLDMKTPTLTKKQKNSQIIEMMQLVGILDARHRLNAYPHELSGGMRQRIMIAMALLGKPDLLIADEPTTALDVTIQAQILTLLKSLKDRFNLTIVLVTHDLGIIAQLCDRVGIFYGGKVVELSSVYSIFKQPQHPYTKALLRSLPQINQTSHEPLKVIQGYPKLWRVPPKLCVFKARCEQKIPLCNQKMPTLLPLSEEPSHKVACLLQKGAPSHE